MNSAIRLTKEHNYAIGFLKNHLKHLYSFVESIEVFQYYPATMEKSHPNMSSEQAKGYIAQLESAIKRLEEAK